MFITSMSQVKKLTPAEILGGFKNKAATLPTKSYTELMAEIAKLEKLAAIAMADETFLDCDYKVSTTIHYLDPLRCRSVGYVACTMYSKLKEILLPCRLHDGQRTYHQDTTH